MTECFNGHAVEVAGCDGCHHAFHVKAVGRVAEGRLIPPAVDGPEDCHLCHEARHQVAVDGCPRCAGRFTDNLVGAMKAWEPVREEILMLKIQGFLLSWRMTLVGWLGIGVGARELHPLKQVGLALFVPFVQWVLRREIRKRESKLPRLGPKGDIEFGDPEIEG